MLVDEQSCSWQEHSVPLHERGVRLSWLIAFVESIYRNTDEPLLKIYNEQYREYERALAQQKASISGPWANIPWIEAVHPQEPKLLELTTRTLVADYIIPLTESIKAPLYARVPPSERGKPDTFLSHAWDAVALAKEGGGYGTLDAFRGLNIVDNSGVGKTFVWIDIICYNQHKVAEDTIAFDMEAVLKSIGKIAFAVTPVTLFDRIWCLWELLCASRCKCENKFYVAPTFRMEQRIMVNKFFDAFTSVSFARATKQEDLDKLLNAIIAHFRSTTAADKYILKLMKTGMVDNLYSKKSNLYYSMMGLND